MNELINSPQDVGNGPWVRVLQNVPTAKASWIVSNIRSSLASSHLFQESSMSPSISVVKIFLWVFLSFRYLSSFIFTKLEFLAFHTLPGASFVFSPSSQ